MELLKEVDFTSTRKNARYVLKQYKRYERIAGRSLIDIRSPLVSYMPRNQPYGNWTEDAIIQHAEAEAERDAIIAALYALKLTSRQILYYSFCYIESLSNRAIACKMGYSERQIERLKSEALIEFAEAYRKGKLIEYY